MTEELPLKEETEPTSEPLVTSGLPEADRKRVMIGSAIGGGIFLGVLIAIIVLVSTEEAKPHPTPIPPDPKDIYPHFNPFFIDTVTIENERLTTVHVINKRKELEGNVTKYDYTYDGQIPIVKDTLENAEPQRLTFFSIDYDEHLSRFIMNDPEFPRWHVPYFGNHSDPYAQAAQYTHTPSGFRVLDNVNNSFQWQFIGKLVSVFPIITTKNCRLQYFDKYIEFEGIIEKDLIYGMGERIETFHLKNDNYTLWNRYYPYNVGGDTENGMYGSHPFILSRATDNGNDDFIAYYMHNSNAMMFSMWDDAHNGTIINYKMIGGVLDLYLFHTADPQYIIRKYHSVIGRPYLPAVWAMGYQQARSGYTVKDFEEIIAKSQEHRIPVDAVWADTEMNTGHMTFTVNTNTFAGIKDLVVKMHDPKLGIDMHFVAIVTPALKVDPTYPYYAAALAEQSLIMSASGHDVPFEGRTMAGTSVWLDFFLHNSTLIWAGGLHQLHELTQFDGVWITDNEIYQFCSGDCAGSETDGDVRPNIPNPFHNSSEFNYIQFRPTLDPLDADTLPMSAYHYGDLFFHKQYFTHNLYGLQISEATFNSIYGIFEDKRFLIASRSTWPGSGQFASHWLDGNYGDWESMATSISGMLNFNLFGIPHVGAPIGGYFGNCTDECLVRWFELGTYSPLMLSYSNAGTNRKEPYAEAKHINAIRNTMMERYNLLRFMYTKMFEAFAWGGAVIHPLFFDFINDTEVYTSNVVERTFMWSHTLYIAPILTINTESIKVYLPNWRWYDLRTKEMIADYNSVFNHGSYHVFTQTLGFTTVLIKGGSIIPYQRLASEAKVMNTKDLEKIPAQIIVAPSHEGKAIGSMLVDTEGIRPHPDPKSHTYRHYTFTYMNQIFRINKLAGFEFPGNYEFDNFWEIMILDVYGRNQVAFVCMMDMYMRKKELQHSRPAHSNSLTIHDIRAQKVPMYSLEAVVWGSPDQHDFCQYQLMLSSMQLSREDRVLMGKLENFNSATAPIKLEMLAVAMTDHIAYLRIRTEGGNEWKVPGIVEEDQKVTPKATKSLDAVGFGTSHLHVPFYFEMSEEDDPHDFLLTTRNQPFVYLKNFIQIKFLVAGRHIFGLGERVGKFELADGVYSLWNYDAMHEETGSPPGNNMYGYHPFYLIHTHNPTHFAGVFFLTSNPMDVRIKHIGMQTELDHILTGGIVELFMFGKGPAEMVLRHYHEIIGKPMPLPFWAFGYHQSRWGYKDIKHLQTVVHAFDANSIPLDAVWVDKDFMIKYRSFTIDTKRWYGLTQFVKELHDKGRHFVAIVDAAIAKDDEFEIFRRGRDQNVYIMSSFTEKMLIGITWSGYSVWVDFVHSTAANFWTQCLKEFHAQVDFDGLWLDMNEPSNFCDGECPDEITYHYYFFPLDYYDDLYYNPTHRPIEDNTISMEALHSGDPKTSNEFNYHALYGLLQSKVTHNYFTDELQKRPFVISSSTYPGSGRYAAHWLGDNYSTWMNMEYSIAGMLNFNLFGIPFVGANVCGYTGNISVSLCGRWMQLGAFYPLMRNHNGPDGAPQEPYVDPKLMSISKKALQLRYSLVRYIYTEYMHTVLRGGSMIRPLVFSFPEDNDTYSTLDTSFMIGPGLRVTPILEDGKDAVDAYFPNADWYYFQAPDYRKVLSYNHTSTKGKVIQVHSSLDGETINLHVRSGAIIIAQDAHTGTTNVLKLHELPIYLVVVPNQHHSAWGEVLYDSEHHANFHSDHQDIMIHLNGSQLSLNMTSGSPNINYSLNDRFISKIIILGASGYKAATTAKYDSKTQQGVAMKPIIYDAVKEIMTIEPVDEKSMNVLELNKVYWT